MLESYIERRFVNHVVSEGDLCLKIKILGIIGFPDRIIFFKEGGFMWMELKAPGRKPRKIQLHRMKLLRSYNHAVYWADSLEKAIETYEKERFIQAAKTSSSGNNKSTKQ